MAPRSSLCSNHILLISTNSDAAMTRREPVGPCVLLVYAHDIQQGPIGIICSSIYAQNVFAQFFHELRRSNDSKGARWTRPVASELS